MVLRGNFDTTFDGLRAGGFNAFARFVGESKDEPAAERARRPGEAARGQDGGCGEI
jgi:hypothetical protein